MRLPFNNFYNACIFLTASFTCEFEGKRYRANERFTTGDNECAECICIDGRVDCDDAKCHPILVDPPEGVTVASTTTSTTTTTTTTPRTPIQPQGSPRGSEKGPSQADYSYYAHQLTDVNPNSEKGPLTDAMSYMPEQYNYMQAVGQPGLRGPPGLPGPSGSSGTAGPQG